MKRKLVWKAVVSPLEDEGLHAWELTYHKGMGSLKVYAQQSRAAGCIFLDLYDSKEDYTLGGPRITSLELSNTESGEVADENLIMDTLDEWYTV